MDLHNLEPMNGPEKQAQRHVSAPETVMRTETSRTEGRSDLHAETAAEVQRTFQDMRAPWSTRWLLGHSRRSGASIKIKAEDADRLLQMDVEEVLALLQKERQRRPKVRIQNIKIGLGVFFLSLLLAKFAHITFLLQHWTTYLVVMFTGVAVSQKGKAAALVASRFDDVRVVGPLAEALEFKDKAVLSVATGALIRLLPRMQASDGPLLSPAQRACLNRALQRRNFELSLAILKAWEQVGDANAIPDVQSLAEGRGEGGRITKVVQAAKECLPTLRQSAERRQIGAQLLRPAQADPTPLHMLLRPAQPHASTEPSNQLLRSAEGNDQV